MLRTIVCITVFLFFAQAAPNTISKQDGPVPGYKRASLLELKGDAADIIQVAPLSFDLQQRYQIEHPDEVADIEPEEPITVGKASLVMKMNKPKQAAGNPGKNMRVVVGMDEHGEMRMMQIPKYDRAGTWKENI